MIPLGESVVFGLTHEIYTPTAIKETIQAFQKLCNVEAASKGDCTNLQFHIKADCPTTTCDDFLNYALELSAQERLSGKE